VDLQEAFVTDRTPDTREEAASKLPALHVLMVMGWTYLPPSDALAMRGSERSVVLEPVLREWLTAHRFDFKGQCHPLSDSGINQVIKAITTTKLNEGLIAANEAIYKQLTLGITVDEFVDGNKTSVTVPLVDWSDIDANLFHVTEELSVERPAGMGRYRPDVVCYVNGLPLVVIEAKRPTSSSAEKSMVAEGISQHNRNQKVQGIQTLYAYSQLLLSISGTDARYGTTDTPKKFWGSWTEEEITEAQMQDVKSTLLTEAQKASLFDDKPRWAKDDFERLHSGPVLPNEQKRPSSQSHNAASWSAAIRD
jgi:type I restriction enzyme R subunit